MNSIRIPNCQTLSFSDTLSNKRIERASSVFGANVINRLLCFALYLLGLNRQDIGKVLGIPGETAKSIIKVLMRDGLNAMNDRRQQPSHFITQACTELPPITLNNDKNMIIIDLGVQDRQIKIDLHDTLQVRTVLLTMLNSGLFTVKQVAKAIGLSPQHTTNLAQQLKKEGALSLVEKRKGQTQDYRVTKQIKAELIQQFAVNAITGQPTSAASISDKLEERCQITIPTRTIRHHLNKLMLPQIKHSLPQLVEAVKKNSGNGVSK